ncbi:iron ABC transporter permease [Hoyosella sp. YIM 151337]|uniref:FecCD family ABC transporter permease n=1 Tax=Hoyosella sp. YIM 151337 TaxID=2992742 RepID=UPI002236A66A|nr:iron ABC transporter permease [Hoyosella sp. YIM 151337]MCW4354482.1 iron ABC transporter permease [Hoyosella sp. YIM 151337]
MTAITVALAVLVFLLMCVNIGRGDYPIALGQVVEVLGGGGTSAERFIIVDLRLPRSLVGILVGIALGVAGAITQSLTRNPLASPDILGISTGASVFAVALIVLTGGSIAAFLGMFGLSAAALMGALITAVLLFLLSWKGGVDGFRLILIGIAVTAVGQALIYWMLIISDIHDVARAQAWLVGSLNGRDWRNVYPMLTVVLIVGTIAVVAAFYLAVLRLGEDSAQALGVRLQTSQAVLLLCAVGLTAASVAAAGPIGFVGLMAPQIALRLVRSAGPPIIASGLTGAALVLLADIVARTVLPVELPAGIVTAALGGPFLLYLLVRTNRKVSA